MIGNKINLPLVSIIMNCYNGEEYLREAIDSVLSQSYENWELIFWDNKSIDETSTIVKSYGDKRICYHLAEINKPLSAARNLAIQKAKGEYIAFLDSDDVWLPEKLEKQLDGLIEQKDAGISFCGFKTLLTSDTESAVRQADFYSKFLYKSHNSRSIYNNLLKGNYIIFSTVIIKRDVLDLTGGFSEFLEQNEDFEILLKSSLYTNAICIKDVLVKYRIHASNNSYLNARKNFTESKYIFANLPKSFLTSMALDRNRTREIIYYIFFEKEIKQLFNLFNPVYWPHIGYLFFKKIYSK
ncbi:glycosyltransferase [Flavobacterium sp. JAS]|uniref:glycosyltransferase family 2 protein n=1 Tax=Flavobacterium sp. JAS TaxID=2897329 RepID=UPI001E2AACA0|nr:glycosyltransferase [Flavobacterium sp. JAS]MCD0471063.1 glycosyltransferase [Flavobacterium sp. JAS]